MIDQVLSAEQELAEEIGSMVHSPHRYVNFVYPWTRGELEGETGPRNWQNNVLVSLSNHLKDKKTRHQVFRVAVASGHGIGKTALIAWISNWAMDTFEDTKVILTANTDTQIRTKIKPELDKWWRLSITKHWWSVNATSITSRSPGHERTWRMDLIPWSENNPQAFAGLHNKGRRIVVIFDEASEISDRIYEVVEGALTDSGTEIIWIAFSQMTLNTGRFRECFGKFGHRWMKKQIDSREVEGTNKDQIKQWAEDYGEDSDFFRIRVRGEAPRVGWNQFISSEDVAMCRKYRSVGHESLPRIGSLDVARFGDDQTVLGDRQGRRLRILHKWRGLNTQQTGAHCVDYIDREKPDALVIDGDGIGGAVVDYLKERNYHKKTLIVEFRGGMPAEDEKRYFNRRSEVWGMMRDSVKAVMELPDEAELEEDLTFPRYGFSPKQQIQLEPKNAMKARGFRSPDCGDMAAMTFGIKVLPKAKPQSGNKVPSGNKSGQGWMG